MLHKQWQHLGGKWNGVSCQQQAEVKTPVRNGGPLSPKRSTRSHNGSSRARENKSTEAELTRRVDGLR